MMSRLLKSDFIRMLTYAAVVIWALYSIMELEPIPENFNQAMVCATLMLGAFFRFVEV